MISRIYSIVSDINKYFDHPRKILINITLIVLIFISLYVLFYGGLSFDGAFHSQAAINLFKIGKYKLDYPIGFTQIKVPFQIVNGFFLYLFGINFVSANLANVLFYTLFWLFIIKLYREFNTVYILLVFILFSLNTSFLRFGFRGYGELPGLVIGLAGIFILTKYKTRAAYILLGSFLIGTALATKWIFALGLFPFAIILMANMLEKNYKFVFYSITGCIISLMLFWSIEYANYSVHLKELLVNILMHSVPVNKNYYANYTERMLMFWVEYVNSSESVTIALIKITGYFLLLFSSLSLLFQILKKVKNKIPVNYQEFFVLIISLYAIEYFLWWLFVSSKPWYRRGLNADILMLLALAISGRNIFLRVKWQKLFNNLIFIIISIILITNVVTFIHNKSSEFLTNKLKGSIPLEAEMRNGISKLPKDYEAYGYTWWQAPRWSFISGYKNKDLWNLSLEDKYEIVTKSTNKFVFLGPENNLDLASYEKVNETFLLSTFFEYDNYSIKKIEGLRDTNALEIEPFVDYAVSDYVWTEGVYPREDGFCWCTPDARFLFNSKDKHELHITFSILDLNHYTTPLYLTIYINNTQVFTEQMTASGDYSRIIKWNGSNQQSETKVRVKISSSYKAIGDTRNLGFLIKQIGFK